MLRTTSNSLVKTIPAWRNASIYSSVKQYSIPATPTPAAEKKEKPSLSQRLGGSGRGKVMAEAASADPFASFLANAKKSRGFNNNNDRRNGNFTPRPRKQPENNGQFADAVENKPRQPRQPRQPRVEGAGNSRSNNNNSNKPRFQQRTPKEGATLSEGDINSNKRQPHTNNKNNRSRENNSNDKDGSRRPNNNRRMSFNRSQPQEVRTRRATTFIDKDIDWASFDTTIMTENTVADTSKSAEEAAEVSLKDSQGDYDRYLSVGADLSWPKMVDGVSISTLVGSNPTFDLSQKTAFMAAVSSATGGAAASARK